jgi:hypothetical protein
LTRAGDKTIKCTAVQVAKDQGELPSFAATKTMIVKICDSVKPK